jgi:hypothetical protein
MPNPLRPEQMKAVLALSANARFEHFVAQVADRQRAWSLWHEGFATMCDDHGTRALPLWPAKDYAELLCTGEWASYRPKEIPIEHLLDVLLPSLEAEANRTTVFPTPEERGPLVAPRALLLALREALAAYE